MLFSFYKHTALRGKLKINQFPFRVKGKNWLIFQSVKVELT